jgi:hypothetical protein
MSTLKTTAIQHLNGNSPNINLDASGNVRIGITTSPLFFAANGTIGNHTGSTAVPHNPIFVIPPGKTKAEYRCTGADQTFVVPAGVTEIYVKLWGAGGAGGVSGGWGQGSTGGGGGCSVGVIPTTPGETLILVVGQGGQSNYASAGSYNYGRGGTFSNNTDNRYVGQGGGYTGIFRTSVTQGNAVMIAGGGGGGGCSRAGFGNWGGAGGGLVGQRGSATYDGRWNYSGNGGTQIAGGTNPINSGNNGSALTGGTGRSGSNPYGGSGGGGYFGGAGGDYVESNTMAGAGGGSGYIGPTVRYGQTFTGCKERPGLYDDNDLPKSVDVYNLWTNYSVGGDQIYSSGQYTSTGGGGGYLVIYY